MVANKKIKRIYQIRFKKYGVSTRSLFWKKPGASDQRFRQISAEIDFSGRSILDVGCGFARFARFIGKKAHNFTYTGVDIVPEFITVAKRKYPQHRFFVRDYLENPMSKKYDVVVASGLLNSNVNDNMDYRKRAITTLFGHTKKVLVFNMLGGYPQPENKSGSNVWYADSMEILKYCLSLTGRVILRHHYNSKDFTIFMYKDQRQ